MEEGCGGETAFPSADITTNYNIDNNNRIDNNDIDEYKLSDINTIMTSEQVTYNNYIYIHIYLYYIYYIQYKYIYNFIIYI